MAETESPDELITQGTVWADGAIADPADDPISGDRIGRFVVRETLGRGGMGLVLSAHDPDLERQVAIKLVKSRTGSGTGADAKARLLREAIAMARFRHPNIVSVFEVGEHQGNVYVAMEQVDGGNLREAIDKMNEDGEADWRRVVGLFAKAGRGLAAAHVAGMVHRDFKPDNVLIDRDDRVLVGDFGIVSKTGSSSLPMDMGENLFSEQLTRADSVLGTPAYMAPEQHSGAPVDARADQFSFCVALYEALYGQLPFAGNTYASYFEAVRKGEVRGPAPGRRVPTWLLQLLTRGLAPDPADRFASMEALLLELSPEPELSRRLGGTERMVLTGSLVGFAVVWAAAINGFDVELSYTLHYVTDVGFLGLMAVLGFFARHALARSEFNRRALSIIATAGVSVVVLVVGGQLAGITPHMIGVLHLLVIGTAALASFGAFGAGVIPMAAVYLGGYLLASARPDLLFPLLLTAHMVAAATALALFRSRTS